MTVLFMQHAVTVILKCPINNPFPKYKNLNFKINRILSFSTACG